jgi:hypothetical protein
MTSPSATKFRPAQRDRIRELLVAGLSQSEIGRAFGCSQANVFGYAKRLRKQGVIPPARPKSERCPTCGQAVSKRASRDQLEASKAVQAVRDHDSELAF